MAHHREPSLSGERLIALAPIVVVVLATTLAFGRIFEGSAATPRLALAAAGSLAIAVLLERRSLLLATAASAAALLVAIGALVFSGTTAFGILPTTETARAILEALERVGDQARTQIAPTQPLRPLLLAAVAAVWTASFSAHALAVRAGSPLLAFLPPVALVGFTDHVLKDDARLVLAILFLAGALGVVFADGLRRIREWGPVWGRGEPRPGGPAHPALGAGRVAVATVLVATFLPGILPGFGARALVDLSSSGGRDEVRLDPLVSVAAQLKRDEELEVFEVSSNVESYWRMLALDVFDGRTWSTPDLHLENAPQVGSGGPLPGSPLALGTLPEEVELATARRGGRVEQRFHVLNDIAVPWVPMAPGAVGLSLPTFGFRYDQARETAGLPGGLASGTIYQAVSVQLPPTFEELDAVRLDARAPRNAQTELPPDLPQEILEIARAWTADEPTPFRKVLRIQERLRSAEFVYDTEVAPEDTNAALVDFLTRTKRGFCQQFSSAMAVLVRALGYPARVAVGYRSGAPVEDRPGTWIVKSTDAHSWVEVGFPGHGWIAFEPTPGRSNPLGASYFRAPTPECRESPEFCPGRAGAGPELGEGADVADGADGLAAELARDRREARDRVRGDGGAPLADPLPDEPRRGLSPILVLRVLVLTGLALLLLMPVAKFGLRRWRLGRVEEPRGSILAAYRVFDDRAADVGLAREEGETLDEYRRRLAARVRSSNGDLELLTSLVGRAAYGPDEPTTEEVRAARAAARRAIRDVRREAGPVRTLTGIYRPGR